MNAPARPLIGIRLDRYAAYSPAERARLGFGGKPYEVKVKGPLKAEPARRARFQPPEAHVVKLENWLDAVTAIPRLSARQMIQAICLKRNVLFDDVVGPSRILPVVWARHEAMFYIHRFTTLTLNQIARWFSVHHTSVIHGIRAHESRMCGVTSPKSPDPTRCWNILPDIEVKTLATIVELYDALRRGRAVSRAGLYVIVCGERQYGNPKSTYSDKIGKLRDRLAFTGLCLRQQKNGFLRIEAPLTVNPPRYGKRYREWMEAS